MSGSDRKAVPDYLLWIYWGAVGVIGGTFMPWVRAGFLNLYGVGTSRGMIALICGVVIACLGVQQHKGWPLGPERFPPKRIILGVLWAAMISTLVALWFLADATEGEVGIGVYVTLAGSFAAVLGALKMRSDL